MSGVKIKPEVSLGSSNYPGDLKAFTRTGKESQVSQKSNVLYR